VPEADTERPVELGIRIGELAEKVELAEPEAEAVLLPDVLQPLAGEKLDVVE
jgi:hypothetical protein